MKGYRIQFIRHGMTDANLEGKYIGKTDEPLCSEGVAELFKKLEEKVYPPVQKVYTSPLKRCTSTAGILHPDTFTVAIEELREMDFGDFERCYAAISYIVQDMMNEGLTNCAVVTHGGIIMNMLSCFGMPKLSPMEWPCDFGEGYEVLVTADMWMRSHAFEIMGKYPYLPEEEN